jgi:hypothetical protein
MQAIEHINVASESTNWLGGTARALDTKTSERNVVLCFT